MIKVRLVDNQGRPLHTDEPYGDNGGASLEITNHHMVHGTWKSFDITTQTTTDLANPDINGYLIVSGLTLSARKKNAAAISVQFSDGTNTEAFFDVLLTDGAVIEDMNWADQRVDAWKDAALRIVTTGADPELKGMVRYTRVSNGLTYEEWLAAR